MYWSEASVIFAPLSEMLQISGTSLRTFKPSSPPRHCFPSISEAHHPWWQARVDGEAAEVLRAQLAFMAVRVPPGTHRVELELRPPLALRVADRVSQLAWLAFACAGLVGGARGLRRRASRRS